MIMSENTIIPITPQMIRRAAEESVGGERNFYEYPYNDFDRIDILARMRKILVAALTEPEDKS